MKTTRRIFTLSLIVLAIGIAAYVHNGLTAASDVRSIQTQDSNSQDTGPAINFLKSYVAKHMNSSVNFTLSAGYNRAVDAAKQAQAAAVPSGAVYAQAQAACASHADSITQANCVINYVNMHATPGASQIPQVPMPDLANYTYHFSSPGWTFDLAGILLSLGFAGIVIGAFSAFRNKRKARRV